MKKNCIAICVCILAAFAIVGCGKSDKDMVGNWTAKKDFLSGLDDLPPEAREFAEGFANATATKLELKKDHTFTIKAFFSSEGTWELDGTVLRLSATELGGMPSTKKATLLLSEDRKTLKGDNPFMSNIQAIAFTRDDG